MAEDIRGISYREPKEKKKKKKRSLPRFIYSNNFPKKVFVK
jgi:hypothetical protein